MMEKHSVDLMFRVALLRAVLANKLRLKQDDHDCILYVCIHGHLMFFFLNGLSSIFLFLTRFYFNFTLNTCANGNFATHTRDAANVCVF